MNAISRHWGIARAALTDEKVRGMNLIRTDETSFLPAAMEIVETPVSPTARATTWVLLAMVALAIAWLTFGEIDVVASAPGKLIPADSVKLIQFAEAGIVHAIFVHDGQYVRAGQPLVELDPTISTAELAQARKALETAELDAARNRAILLALDGRKLTLVAPLGTPADVAATQSALASAQFQEILGSAGIHLADQKESLAVRNEARIQAAKLTETLPLLDEQLAANEALLAKGYVSKLKVIEMRRQRLASARDKDAAIQMANKASAQFSGAGSTISQGNAEARSRILADLAKAQSDAKLRREELAKAVKKSNLQVLRSPVSGFIAQLNIHTIGGVVEAAKPIMVVVPVGGKLIAEVKLLNRDIGFVHAGQPVAIKLDPFPFTRYGALTGRIATISSDAVQDDKLGLVYTARVKLDDSPRHKRSSILRASIGMQVTADVRTGRRSIGSFLISPIAETAQDAGHEQ